jgi:thiosulfate/3-mercaptopyruvate sulfurtransferase
VNVRFADCRYDLADPRRAGERYLEAHIPGAAFLDLDADLSDLSIPAEVSGRHPLPTAEQFATAAGRAGIGDGTLVVAYGDEHGSGAARLWWLLRHFGHDEAGVLRHGLEDWIGLLATGEETIEHTMFTPRERTGDTVTTEEIRERLGDPSLRLIDARPATRFRGDDEPLDPVRGHIPGAVSFPAGAGSALPDDLLDAEEIVAYCGSGVAACTTLLALHHAGRTDARLYPGSWSEWSRKGLPAETGG